MTRACLLIISLTSVTAIISQKIHSIEHQFDVKKSLQNSNKNLQNVHQKSYSSEVKRWSKSLPEEHDRNEKSHFENLPTNRHVEYQQTHLKKSQEIF